METGKIYTGKIDNGNVVIELKEIKKETRNKTTYDCYIYSQKSKLFTKGQLEFNNKGTLKEATPEEINEYKQAKAAAVAAAL